VGFFPAHRLGGPARPAYPAYRQVGLPTLPTGRQAAGRADAQNDSGFCCGWDSSLTFRMTRKNV